MRVSGVLIWLLSKEPRAYSFPDQGLKANSEKVLLKPVRDSAVLTPVIMAPQASFGQAETCDLPAVRQVRHPLISSAAVAPMLTLLHYLPPPTATFRTVY